MTVLPPGRGPDDRGSTSPRIMPSREMSTSEMPDGICSSSDDWSRDWAPPGAGEGTAVDDTADDGGGATPP